MLPRGGGQLCGCVLFGGECVYSGIGYDGILETSVPWPPVVIFRSVIGILYEIYLTF